METAYGAISMFTQRDYVLQTALRGHLIKQSLKNILLINIISSAPPTPPIAVTERKYCTCEHPLRAHQ